MKIAVLGYGTVGSGVVEVLDVNQKLIASRAKEEIEVKYVLDLRKSIIFLFKSNYRSQFLTMIISILSRMRPILPVMAPLLDFAVDQKANKLNMLALIHSYSDWITK